MIIRLFSITLPLSLLATLALFILMPTDGLVLQSSQLPAIALALFVLTGIAGWLGGRVAGIEPVSNASQKAHDSRESGTVKWFNASKGFGFITRDCGDDVFVHFRAIRGQGHRVLRDGQRVEFQVSQSDKGLQAEDVAVAH